MFNLRKRIYFVSNQKSLFLGEVQACLWDPKVSEMPFAIQISVGGDQSKSRRLVCFSNNRPNCCKKLNWAYYTP